MKLIKTKEFHLVSVDFYYSNNEFWVTREQIGEILNYKKPERSIKRLHELYEWAFNHLYKEVELNVRRKGICKTVVYNFNGLIKLCSFSGKSRAIEAVNFLWEVKFEFEQAQNYWLVPASSDQELQLFNYGEKQIRVIEQNEEFWFVAKDVCDILELSNAREAIKSLDDDERGSVRISDGTSQLGGNPNMNIINESGLYTLIMRSNKPEARRFRKWVTGTVLPALMRTGVYNVKKTISILPDKATDTKFYSAIEIGEELGVDDIEVVRLANEHNLLFYGFSKDWDWYFTEEGREKILNAARI